MNILFLTLSQFDTLNERNIYTDVLQEFVEQGHFVYAISPVERRQKQRTHLSQDEDMAKVLRLRIGNTQKTNFIEKGISTVLLEWLYIRAIKKYAADICFDLIIFSTPPITLCNAVKYVKCRDHAKTYLLLKDIFPQNSLDLGVLKTTGIKGILYRLFRKKEKNLYRLSDYIGCMSPANVEYLKSHNKLCSEQVVEVNPNCIRVRNPDLPIAVERRNLREKYGIPQDRCVFLYGGNLGIPQDVNYIVECLRAGERLTDSMFVIAGSGTERIILERYVEKERPSHVMLMPQLPTDEYERLVRCCDVGMIFLDHRFTIPNFPSRLLSYMEAGLPVLAMTDRNTDIGNIICEGGFGAWCESVGTENFVVTAEKFLQVKDRIRMGRCAYEYLSSHYTAEYGYEQIMKHFT